MADTFDGRLAGFEVIEHINSETSPTSRCLFDGDSYVWVYADPDGIVIRITRFAGNSASYVIAAIANVFDIDIASEYEPEYWGFNSQEEWDEWLEKIRKEDDDLFYDKLLKFLAGEPCDIRPGTTGMKWAEIAKELVGQAPGLATPEYKEMLLAEIQRIHRERLDQAFGRGPTR